MSRIADSIDLPADLGQRIADLARIAAAIHEQTNSMTRAGGTGDLYSTDGAAVEPPPPGPCGFWRRLFGRIR